MSPPAPGVTVTLDPGTLAALVVGLASVLAAIGYLIRKAQGLSRILRAVSRLVDAELEHNHGGSMKDDVHGIALAVGALSRQVDDIDERLSTHLDRKDTR